MNMLRTAGRINESPITVPPMVNNVRRLNLSAIHRNTSEPRTKMTPWIIGYINAELAAFPVAFSTINGM